ncbi:MAG: efflux RND transporter periplasmic adaptor subunit [Sulfuricurvum sp.]|jgi:RND family efflux transporter MFP subunit
MKFFFSLLTLGSLLNAAGLILSGVIISDNQKMITSRNMGFVTSVNVSEGSRVRKGDLLYTIDSREIDSAKTQVDMGIAQAELSLQMYQNQYENLKVNLDRHRRLYSQDMVSRYEVENLELSEKNLQNTIKISQRQVSQAKARRQEVTNQYQYLRVVAPNNGVVVSKNIKVGEMAMPGMPAIVLSDLSTLKIEVEVAEGSLKMAQIGKRVKVTIPSTGFVGIGTISSVVPSSNPMTHTFKIKVSFSAKQTVYPGMYATVELY